MTNLIGGKTARGMYDALVGDRSPYLERAYQVAELTLPHLMPRDGYSGATLPTPYQSVGARGVSSMAAKLLLALFPSNQSFLRMVPDSGALEELGGGKVEAEVQESLAKIERAVSSDIESQALRPTLGEVFKQLLISGNCLFYTKPGSSKAIRLNSYVVKRDPAGNEICIVIKESISQVMLPDEMRAHIKEYHATNGGDPSQDNVDIYTAIARESEDRFKVWQDICDMTVPGSEGFYNQDQLPWLALRMEPVAGESYGYGYVVGMLGDLSSLEGLMKALVEASAASARVVFLVSPTSTTRPDQLNRAPNGSFVTGMEGDIVALKVDKGADMAVALQAIERLQTSLGFSFMLSQSVQRAGERVTAEEIRFLAQELEDVLAGTYSMLAQELQLPLAKLTMARLEKERKIPPVKGVASPTIITGLEALGRGHDLLKLDAFVRGAMETFGPEITAKWVVVGEYFTRRATALALEKDGLIRSEQEVAEADQAAAQAQTMQSMAPEALKQIGGIAQSAQAAKPQTK